MEVPENGVTGWIVAGAVGLATAAAAMVRSIVKRSNPRDEEMEMFRRALCRDVKRIDQKIDKIAERGEKIAERGEVVHKELYDRLGHMEQAVAVLQARRK